MVGEPDATMQPAPQDNQLMSKHRVLTLKPYLRLERRGQDGQHETEQPDHSASLGDSITSSTRIRFSVHTGYDLNLTRVTFPAQMPSNPPHHRSGAALYYIISGTGANTVDGKTEARGPGSLIYEPYGLVHQWGNPGNEPLTFLAFNINPEGVAAVGAGATAKAQ